ncbi:MAG TPA: nicotinate (nicotinamide) nucleotide adenylyltransferase [Balneolaceae bacterium]|nr:nicotinate (nicotinamide) nucleotide adenylyltransferase [Balneolaceae bacterium]
MEEKPQRIGVFGGTFNPVHNGHVAIAKSFLNSDYIDALWILLNPSPPHKPDEKFAPYQFRLKMLQEAFQSIEHTLVSDLETRLPQPTYTIQTITYLENSYPEREFFLCIGQDSFYSFQTWHKWREILDHCLLLVANRPDVEKETINKKLFSHSIFIDHEPVQVSSTEIRQRVAQGKPIDHLVPAPVLSFIKKENLYTDI